MLILLITNILQIIGKFLIEIALDIGWKKKTCLFGQVFILKRGINVHERNHNQLGIKVVRARNSVKWEIMLPDRAENYSRSRLQQTNFRYDIRYVQR